MKTNWAPRSFFICNSDYADSGGRCVQAVGLRPFDCWDGGFVPRWGYRCSSILFVVCCVGSGPCIELITHSEKSDRNVFLIVHDQGTSRVRPPRTEWAFCAKEQSNQVNNILYHVRADRHSGPPHLLFRGCQDSLSVVKRLGRETIHLHLVPW